ncbi:hypothetical protein AS850_02795 [Frondihabitans sp. 762G35]|uniref:hypothetical protein n=1 Tax=Frondihabitans sp. 762G35 TaxID=1446794 RepID=UPI000D201466|nr:hypothetical protein [Frondihabitans sp. 762G35]ARC56000.1 hypothetical protein AS850_02795 [Frondihabitans sp. 762G35]
MTAQIPHTMPPDLNEDVNFKLLDRELEFLGNDGRLLIRRMCADSYARGIRDGAAAKARDTWTDNEAERLRAQKSRETETAQ